MSSEKIKKTSKVVRVIAVTARLTCLRRSRPQTSSKPILGSKSKCKWIKSGQKSSPASAQSFLPYHKMNKNLVKSVTIFGKAGVMTALITMGFKLVKRTIFRKQMIREWVRNCSRRSSMLSASRRCRLVRWARTCTVAGTKSISQKWARWRTQKHRIKRSTMKIWPYPKKNKRAKRSK